MPCWRKGCRLCRCPPEGHRPFKVKSLMSAYSVFWLCTLEIDPDNWMSRFAGQCCLPLFFSFSDEAVLSSLSFDILMHWMLLEKALFLYLGCQGRKCLTQTPPCHIDCDVYNALSSWTGRVEEASLLAELQPMLILRMCQLCWPLFHLPSFITGRDHLLQVEKSIRWMPFGGTWNQNCSTFWTFQNILLCHYIDPSNLVHITKTSLSDSNSSVK